MLPDALFQGDFLHLQCHCCDPQHHGFQSVALHPKARNGWGRGESLAVCHDAWQRMKAVDFLQSKACHNPTSARSPRFYLHRSGLCARPRGLRKVLHRC